MTGAAGGVSAGDISGSRPGPVHEFLRAPHHRHYAQTEDNDQAQDHQGQVVHRQTQNEEAKDEEEGRKEEEENNLGEKTP